MTTKKEEVDVWDGIEFEHESEKEWTEFLGRDGWMPQIQQIMQDIWQEYGADDFVDENGAYLVSHSSFAKGWDDMDDDWMLNENGEAEPDHE